MNQKIVLGVLLALFAVSSMAKNSDVCQGAKPAANPNNLAGGWVLLNQKQIKENSDLQADAKVTADKKAAADGCTVKSVKIQKACSQVVAGINYQYSSQVQLKCGKKTVPSTVTNTFLVPPTGK